MGGIAEALAAHGLVLFGGFVFLSGEDAPAGPAGRPARSALLVSQAGAEAWPHFLAWCDAQAKVPADPLDQWSRAVIGEIAGQFGASAVSPSDRPFLPFQRWAMRAEGLKPSPLGILMHPLFGLWHAFRGALLFDTELPVAEPPARVHPCDACVEKPCLKACLVGAHTAAGFQHGACLAHVLGAAGKTCRTAGCLDRNACPVASEHRYPPDMQAFLMSAFSGDRTGQLAGECADGLAGSPPLWERWAAAKGGAQSVDDRDFKDASGEKAGGTATSLPYQASPPQSPQGGD
ncbi:MAG: hypothetical protein K0S21_2245 [Rhizobiaceae bacterium]|nr:hypothetical protein [Rhizobiaceae bacterium]